VNALSYIGNNIWSASSDKTIRVWSERGECVKVLEGHASHVFGVLPWNKYAWSCSWDKSLIAWDTNDLHYLTEIKAAHRDAILTMSVVEDSDGRVEVWTGAEDGTVNIWAERIGASVELSKPTVTKIFLPDQAVYVTMELTSSTTAEQVIDYIRRKKRSQRESDTALVLAISFGRGHEEQSREFKPDDCPLILKRRWERNERSLATLQAKIRSL